MNDDLTKPEDSDTSMRKFYFDVHNFDPEAEVEEEVEEDLPPPPPTFSEEELEAARKAAFEEGRARGLKESQESRDQHVAAVLEGLSGKMAELFSAETQREATYEQEATRLALGLFIKLFPDYNAKHGFNELCESLDTILKKQMGHSKISVRVHPDVVEGIRSHIAALPDGQGNKFDITGDEALEPGACKLSWADGGAVRDAKALAEEVKVQVAKVLAGQAAKGHDSMVESSAETGIAEAAEQTDTPEAPSEPIQAQEASAQDEDHIEDTTDDETKTVEGESTDE